MSSVMTENVAMGENVEEGEVEHSPELITPPQKPKRPQSAYFLFMMEKRVELKDAHADWGIGEIGKECGRLWNELPEEQKKKYHDMTVPLKEKFDKEMVVYNEKMQEFEASRFGEDGTLLPAKISNCLPLARIKKIMRLDPDMKSVSKEASLLVSWATELFVSQLADEAGKVANGRRRRGIKYEEVSATIRKSELMAFLAQDFPPTNPSRSIVSSSSSKSKNVPAVTAGAIDTFFTASKPDIASS